MVFSRLVVSSVFLITVIAVPISVPEAPSRRAGTRIRVSEIAAPSTALIGMPLSWSEPFAVGTPVNPLLDRLDHKDAAVRHAAINEAIATPGGLPAEAASYLARHMAQDDVVREALMQIGAPAAETLGETLESGEPLDRAVAAYLLSRIAPMTWTSRILPVACAALAANDETGDARYGVMTLLSIGAPALESARTMLASRDDQAAVCALIILARGSVVRAEDLAVASPALNRLAFRWPYEGDDLDVVTEVFSALGGIGERMIHAMSAAPRPDAFSRALALWKACADPNRDPWMPRGRRSRLIKIE